VSRGRRRVHLASDVSGKGLCGWAAVDVETDVSRVTCKVCLSMLAGKRAKNATSRSLSQAPTRNELSAELARGIRAELGTAVALADATPVITPAVWASSCKAAEYRRCGDCAICVWEREAERYAFAAPWNRSQAPARLEGAPRWPSLAAALAALVEFEAHDRTTPSALGGMLDRMRRGATGSSSGEACPDDPLMRRAGELVRVRQALELAYPEGAHESIPAEKLRAVLLLRTPGVAATMMIRERKSACDAPTMPSYEQLAELFAVSVGELLALVRKGRRIVVEDLAERGLIPIPRPRRFVVFHKGTNVGPTAEILPRMLRELDEQNFEGCP
jgi:hypothetical protein